jgi:hypothetical protein
MTEIPEGQAPYNTKIDDDGSATTSGTGTSNDTVSCCASEWVDDVLDLDDLPTLSANDIPDSLSDTSGTVALTEKAKKKNGTDPDYSHEDPASPSNTAASIAQAEVANNASFSFSKNTSHASRISGFPDTDDVDVDPPSVPTQVRRNIVGVLKSTVGSAFGVFHGAPATSTSSSATTQSQDRVVDPPMRETRAPSEKPMIQEKPPCSQVMIQEARTRRCPTPVVPRTKRYSSGIRQRIR